MSRASNIRGAERIEIWEELADGGLSHAEIAQLHDRAEGTIGNIASQDAKQIQEIVQRSAAAIKPVWITRRQLRIEELADIYQPQKDAFLLEAAKADPDPILLRKISVQLQAILLQAAEESGDRFARLPNEGPPPTPIEWTITREPSHGA